MMLLSLLSLSASFLLGAQPSNSASFLYTTPFASSCLNGSDLQPHRGARLGDDLRGICKEGDLLANGGSCNPWASTANLRTKILDFRGFYSSRIFNLRGGNLLSIGNLPEILSQRILVGILLVGRLGVPSEARCAARRLCRYQPTSLELDDRPLLLSEQECPPARLMKFVFSFS